MAEYGAFTAEACGVVKNINPAQLKDELGGVDVFTSNHEDGCVDVCANVPQEALDAAISAHVAVDVRAEAIDALKRVAESDPSIARLLTVLGIS